MMRLALIVALALASAFPAQAQTELAPLPVWPKGVPSMKGWPGLAAVPVQEERRENGEQVFNVTVQKTLEICL